MNGIFTGKTVCLVAISGLALIAAPAHAQFMDTQRDAGAGQYQNYAPPTPTPAARPVYNGSVTTLSTSSVSVVPNANETVLALPPTTLPDPILQQAPPQPAAYEPVYEPHNTYTPQSYANSVATPAPQQPYSDPYADRYVAKEAKPAPIKWQDQNVPTIPLTTQTGFDIGAAISDYRYQEHVVSDVEFMHITGPKISILADATKAYKSGFYWGGDLRMAYGKSNYTGSDINLTTSATIPANHPDENDWLVDGRLLAGHDFVFGGGDGIASPYALSPYSGIGYRYLYNDGRGNDSNGVAGYRRFANYVYLPLGVTQRFRATDTTRVSFNLEYDQLLYGLQVSALGDTIPSAGPLHNAQNSGYGLRGSLTYDWPAWSFGPFFNYWNINQSDTNCVGSDYGTLCGNEPHNQTMEFGAQLKYHFTAN
jgi:hypothetical protein